MKFIIAFCTLAASASVYIRDVEHSQDFVTIINEKTGHNFSIKTPADHKVHHIYYLSHGSHGGGGSMMATSVQRTGNLSPDTSCVTMDHGIKLDTLDAQHTFTWIS